MKKNVFIIGSKGIPANYGGFETFVEQLTARQENKEIAYHVACLDKERSMLIFAVPIDWKKQVTTIWYPIKWNRSILTLIACME